MSDNLSDNFKKQCSCAASCIAYEYCIEYAYAVEEGLRLAKTHFNEYDNLTSIGGDVSRDEADIILQSVRSKTGNAIDLIEKDKMQFQAKGAAQSGEEKTYKYFPEITMKSTLLDRRYHKVARKIIESVFQEYEAIIEGAKQKALDIVCASPDRLIDNAIEVLESTIHDSCKCFHLSLFDIRRKIESNLSEKAFEQQDVSEQTAKLAEMVNPLFQHDDSGYFSFFEKRKQIEDLDPQSSKKIRQQVAYVDDGEESSDDDFEVVGFNKATKSIAPQNTFVNATRSGIDPLSSSRTSAASNAKTESGSNALKASRVSEAGKVTLGTAGTKEKQEIVSQHFNNTSTSSSSVKEYEIDEILENGVKLTLEYTREARTGLTAILHHFKRAGLVQLLKKGLSKYAKELIVAMVNGNEINGKRIKRIHDKGTQEGKVSVMMIFIASLLNSKRGTERDLTQSTFKSFITVTNRSQNKCISDNKFRPSKHNQAAHELLNAEETRYSEKLCVPIWTLDDDVEKYILSTASNKLRKSFSSDDYLVREVAHLVRCALILICWTIQDESLNMRIRDMYKRGKPFIGLNDILPIDAFYFNRGPKNKEKAEESISGHENNVIEDSAVPFIDMNIFTVEASYHAAGPKNKNTAVGSTSGHKSNVTKDVARHESFGKINQPTKESVAKYKESAKALLGDGLRRKLTQGDVLVKGVTLAACVYLSNHMNFSVRLTPEWRAGKNLRVDDWVLFKLIVGSQYQYSIESTGAKLMVCYYDSAGKRQESQVLVTQSGEKVIRQILLDREKGKF